ncbi:Phosphoribosylglycinamide formyltransferase [gamma proteobacterium IMCC2047]|nr:Phosphoribosylglycinamide formyltransferase [gamma proteobacterium IMCC2047]
MSKTQLNVVALISGGGSNLQALIQDSQHADSPFRIVGVISNRPQAGGLQHAERAGIEQVVIDHSNFQSRESFDQAMTEAIDQWNPDLVVLAGFMRILTPAFVTHYLGRMINIHPALLPKCPGLDTHQRAIDAGESHHGASVHYVIPELDAGPVILQASVDVLPNDTATELAARVLQQEHKIYPQSVRWIAEGKIHFKENQVYLDGELLPANGHQITL